MSKIEIPSNPYQYQFEEGYSDSSGYCDHLVYAYLDKELVGTMSIDARDGVILDVFVEPDHRHGGVATALFNLASEHVDVEHCNERTPDGDAWARSLDSSLKPAISPNKREDANP